MSIRVQMVPGQDSFKKYILMSETRPEFAGDSGSKGAGPFRFPSWVCILCHLGASWGLSCRDSLKKQISMVYYDFWGANPHPFTSKTPAPGHSKKPELGGHSGLEAAGASRFASWGCLLCHLGASWGISCRDGLKKQIFMVCYDCWAPLEGLLRLTPTPYSGPGNSKRPELCGDADSLLGAVFCVSWGLLGHCFGNILPGCHHEANLLGML